MNSHPKDATGAGWIHDFKPSFKKSSKWALPTAMDFGKERQREITWHKSTRKKKGNYVIVKRIVSRRGASNADAPGVAGRFLPLRREGEEAAKWAKEMFQREDLFETTAGGHQVRK